METAAGEEMDTAEDLIADQFEWAVIRLATYQDQKSGPSRLLCATISLLAPGRPRPSRMSGVESHKINRAGGRVHFRRVTLTSADALDWYRSLGDDTKTPVPSLQEDVEIDLDGKHQLLVSDLEDSPPWPNFGLPIQQWMVGGISSEANPVPYLGSSSARTHRRLSRGEGFEAFLENPNAIQFINRRIHIDLARYPEYLGGAVISAPDPIVERIDNFMVQATESQGERIIFRFIPRKGKTLAGLQLYVFDEHALLINHFESFPVPEDGIVDIEKGSCYGAYGYVVTHPHHGVLSYHPQTSFLRTMSVTMGLVTQTRKVTVPTSESTSSDSTTYSVSRVSRERESIIGERPERPRANEIVGRASQVRRASILAERLDQRWFGVDQRDSAMSFIRDRVGRARRRVKIADPYFGVLQIPQFLLAITSEDVEVSVLTSRLAFEGNSSPEAPDDQPATRNSDFMDRLRRFSEEVERVKASGNEHFRVSVLGGKSPPLHDRFLIIDDSVWFLGNSLNALGTRASMIIKLPDPVSILREIEAMERQAVSFEAYRDRMEVVRSRRGDEEPTPDI